MPRIPTAAALLLLLPAAVAPQAPCRDAPLGVQVLGSGGPFAGSRRASSGYLVWRQGDAIAMVDAGGGTFLRFGEAGAHLDGLEALAISHLHPDHVSDLPALLWLSEAVRARPLRLVGPSAGGVFPDIESFTSRLFDSGAGAFPILGGTLGDADRRGTRLHVHVVDVTGAPSIVFRENGIELRAMGVPHSSLGVAEPATPSVAYRVEVDGRSVVFGSDQNGSEARFVDFARDADVLVMHLAASRDNAGDVHATPQVVGGIARDARARRLVLSHIIEPPEGVPNPGRFSGPRLEESVALVESLYAGPVDVAEDLQCFRVR